MNQKSKIILLIVVVVLALWAGFTFINKKPVMETGPIKIGLSAPLTGEAASFGDGVLGAAQLAIKEINDAGGVDGRLLELVVEDDKCNSSGASAVQKLVEVNKVVAISGPMCSSAAGPSVTIAQQAGIPMVIVASAPKLTKTGDFIFRNYPSDAFQGKFAAEYMFNNLKKTKVAVIYVKNDWGQGIQEVFINRFKELGGEVIFVEGVTQDSTDFRTTLAKIKALNPDGLYLPIYPTNAGSALKQISELGMKIPVLGGDTFGGEEVTKFRESEGALFVTAKLAVLNDFQEKVKTVTGKTTNPFSSFTYDSIKIIAKAIDSANSTDGEKIKDELANMVYTDSISVPRVEFDQSGDLKSADYDVFVIKNGKTEKYTQ